MSVTIDLTGKIAVVTGASSGNGLKITTKLVEAGANCVAIDIKPFPKAEKDELGKRVQYIKLDLNSNDLLKNIETSKIINIPKIDYLINNAGITIGNSLLNYKYTDWANTLNINLTSIFLLTQYFVKHGINEGGSVVNIGSLASELGFPGNVAYCASKGGVKQLTKALAVELAHSDIRVNSVCPGYIKTNMTSKSWKDEALRAQRSERMLLKRWGESEDVANACLFLCSELSSYITGQEVYVDGGWLAKGL